MTVILESRKTSFQIPRLRKMRDKYPRALEQATKNAATISKKIMKQVLDQFFGSSNRLSKGVFTTIRKQANQSQVLLGIKASGKPGTKGKEKLVRVLDLGTFKAHPIFPRAVARRIGGGPVVGGGPGSQVLAMDKGPEGVVFRRYVLKHSIRPRRFTELAMKRIRLELGKASEIFKFILED